VHIGEIIIVTLIVLWAVWYLVNRIKASIYRRDRSLPGCLNKNNCIVCTSFHGCFTVRNKKTRVGIR
jgi:hypothetical protein